MTQYTLHTSSLFDPKQKRIRENVSVTVDSTSGLIVKIFERDDKNQSFEEVIKPGDIDLRGKYVMPGLVDAHTHVFLHTYEYVLCNFLERRIYIGLISSSKLVNPVHCNRKEMRAYRKGSYEELIIAALHS